MRLLVGVDANGHQYAVDVSTFEKLKAYILRQLQTVGEERLTIEVRAIDTEEKLLIDTAIMDMLYELGILPSGRDLFVQVYDPLPEANDPLIKEDPILPILQAATGCSLQSTLIAAKISRILDAVIWDRDAKKVAQLVRDLDKEIKAEKDKAFVEGKASAAPKEAIKLFDEALEAIQQNVMSARISIQKVKEKK